MLRTEVHIFGAAKKSAAYAYYLLLFLRWPAGAAQIFSPIIVSHRASRRKVFLKRAQKCHRIT